MHTSVSTTTVLHLAGAVTLLFGLDTYLSREIRSLNTDAASAKRSIIAAVARTRSAAVEADDAREQSVEALAAELAAAPVEMNRAMEEAVFEAQRYVGSLLRQMTQVRHRQLERTKAELASLRAAAKATDEEASRLHDEVHSTKWAVLGAQETAGDTRAGLRPVSGALPDLNGRIDEGGARLAILRGAARRETFPFTAHKAAPQTTTYGLAIRLRRTDLKRQRCSLEVKAADGQIINWRLTIGEPIRFRTATASGWYEMVVTQIAKDEVGGLVIVAGSPEVARGYSSGSAETRYLPGR